MQRPFQILCLAAAGLLALGALTYAAKKEAGAKPVPAAATTGSASSQPLHQPPAGEPAPPLQVAEQAAAKSNTGETRTAPRDAGWIGVRLDSDASQGIRVKEVFPGGPAAFAGVRAGDVIARIGGSAPTSEAAAAAAIERVAPKQQLDLQIKRGKKTIDLKVTAESKREFKARYHHEMMRRDPRDPKFAERDGVSDSDMSAEMVRRLFEQNHRLEVRMQELLEEVHALRKEVRGSSK